MNPKLVVEQKITPFVNRYAVYAANPDGSKAHMVAFAQQKRIAIKEKIIFYTDDTKANVAFSFRAEKVFDIHGRYFVEDAQGQLIGVFQKAFSESLFISTWNILDASGNPALKVTESSATLAMLRRFIGLIPIIGDYLALVILFFKYHFQFINAQNQIVGKYEKTTLFRDHYLLSLTDEATAQIDWRTYASMAVALDALQSR